MWEAVATTRLRLEDATGQDFAVAMRDPTVACEAIPTDILPPSDPAKAAHYLSPAAPKSGLHISKHVAKNVHWEDVKEAAPEMWQRVLSMAERYGYTSGSS
jgi:hypothetical protein